MWDKYKLSVSSLSCLYSFLFSRFLKSGINLRGFFFSNLPSKTKYLSHFSVFRSFISKNICNFIYMFLTLLGIFFIVILSLCFTSVSKNIIPIIILLNTVYIFLNLWYYFINIYRYGNYTSTIQRFWKRTLMLFWIIELFLFSIFTYLWLIAPEETSFFIDSFSQNNYFFSFGRENFIYMFCLVFLTYFWFSMFFQKKKNNHKIFIFFSFLIILFLFLIEYLRFIQLLNFTSMKEYSFTYNASSIVESTITSLSQSDNSTSLFLDPSYTYRRTTLHYNSLVVFLKFWHFIFIVLIMLLSFQKALSNVPLSSDMLAANLQNTLILYFFFLLNYLFFLKKYFYIFLKYIYFWFYEDYSMREFLLFTLFEVIQLIKSLI